MQGVLQALHSFAWPVAIVNVKRFRWWRRGELNRPRDPHTPTRKDYRPRDCVAAFLIKVAAFAA